MKEMIGEQNRTGVWHDMRVNSRISDSAGTHVSSLKDGESGKV